MPPTGDVHDDGDFNFKSFFLDIPPVTRTLFILTFTSTALSVLGLIPISMFILEWGPIIQKFQIWRLILTFFHMGGLGIKFLIKMYFLYSYSQQLERGVFFDRPANYAWFLSMVASFIALASLVIPTYVNASSILLAIIHLWGRHADNVTVNLYGFIQIPAKYFSLSLLLIGIVASTGFSLGDGLGLLGGHLYYFLDSVYPRMPEGKQYIFVPFWFQRLVERLQDGLASMTGLGRGAPVDLRSRRDASSRTSGMSGPQGNASSGSSSGVQRGFTTPQMRGGHTWGKGQTLGS